MSLQPHTDILRLHDVKSDVVNSDIELYLKTKLAVIAKSRSDCDLMEDWPSPQDINTLCRKATGFFIYASTVVRFVASQGDPPDERLALIVSLPQDTSHEGKEGIDLLYTQVLRQIFCGKDQIVYLHFRLVVGTVILISNPLSMKALSGLLRNHIKQSRVHSTLRTLHSLLLIPETTETPVRIFHKSFPDFLMDPGRCTDTRFFVDPPNYHRQILLSCLGVMKGELRKNICNLDDTPLSEVKDLPACRAASIGDTLGYACQFWTAHLVGTADSILGVKEVQKGIDEFFTTYFLFWIEVLSLMENLGIGVNALNDIQQWYTLVSCVENLLRIPIFMYI